MAASKKFELYLKKHIFTSFLVIFSFAILYGVYSTTVDNSLSSYRAGLKKHIESIDTMQTSTKSVYAKFNKLREHTNKVSMFNYDFNCEVDINQVDSQISIVD